MLHSNALTKLTWYRATIDLLRQHKCILSLKNAEKLRSVKHLKEAKYLTQVKHLRHAKQLKQAKQFKEAKQLKKVKCLTKGNHDKQEEEAKQTTKGSKV